MMGWLLFVLLGTQNLFVGFARSKQASEESMKKRKKRKGIYLPDTFQSPFPVRQGSHQRQPTPQIPVCILPTFWWPPRKPRGEDFRLSQKVEEKTTQGEYWLRKKKKERIGIWNVIVRFVSPNEDNVIYIVFSHAQTITFHV